VDLRVKWFAIGPRTRGLSQQAYEQNSSKNGRRPHALVLLGLAGANGRWERLQQPLTVGCGGSNHSIVRTQRYTEVNVILRNLPLSRGNSLPLFALQTEQIGKQRVVVALRHLLDDV